MIQLICFDSVLVYLQNHHICQLHQVVNDIQLKLSLVECLRELTVEMKHQFFLSPV